MTHHPHPSVLFGTASPGAPKGQGQRGGGGGMVTAEHSAGKRRPRQQSTTSQADCLETRTADSEHVRVPPCPGTTPALFALPCRPAEEALPPPQAAPPPPACPWCAPVEGCPSEAAWGWVGWG